MTTIDVEQLIEYPSVTFIMLAVIAVGLLTLFLAYVIYLVISNNEKSSSDNDIDAFIVTSQDEEGSTLPNSAKKDHYRRVYDTPGKQLLILYGTEYGFSEEIAKKLFDRIDSSVSEDDEFPWQPRVVNVKQYENIDFSKEFLVLVVISTAGDGIPPTEAREFFNWLLSCQQDLGHMTYSVLALGDSNYPHYCRTGKIVDDRMRDLGCEKLVEFHTVDMEDWEVINRWSEQVTSSLDTIAIEPCLDYLVLWAEEEETGPSRNRPFMARLMLKRPLTHVVDTDADFKETIHCEFELTNSGITWISGDALGIYPENNPEEVKKLLSTMKASGWEMVDVPKWAYGEKMDDKMSLEAVLMKYYDLKTVRPELLQLLQKEANGTACYKELHNLLKDGISRRNTFLHEYLYEREVCDVLNDFITVSTPIPVVDILAQMKSLQPRYYSIASSPVIDRLSVNQSCPVFISHNPEFRLPSDGDIPVILVGPGTGIAPFMAFISERIHMKARGRNRFYFGCRHEKGDFLYKEELETWAADGKLELRTAFSRDQDRKIYVQNLLAEDADIILTLIMEQNAHIYICGDAKYMAKDVHKALQEILMTNGSMTDSDADKFLSQLESSGRYQKDVWVT